MRQGVPAALFLHVAQKIHIEKIFPGPPAQGPRLHLGQADVPQRKDAQAFVERAGQVAGGKNQRDFVGPPSHGGASGQQDKASVILAVVFQILLQDARPIDRSRSTAGNSGCSGNPPLRQHLHRSGGVVERHLRHPAVSAKEPAALRQRHRMRIHLSQILPRGSGEGDQVVHDAEVDFPHNVQPVFHQQVVVLIDRPGQGVFNRHQAIARFPSGHAGKSGGKSLARQQANATAQQLMGGFLAERPALSLKGDNGSCHSVSSSRPERAAMLPRRIAGNNLCVFRIVGAKREGRRRRAARRGGWRAADRPTRRRLFAR